METRDSKLYLRRANGHEHFILKEGECIFRHPTILCCGGMDNNHASAAQANGFSKKADALLNTIESDYLSKPFQVAAVTYADSCLIADLRAYNMGQMPPDMFKRFVDEQLVPLLLDADGKRLSLEEVQRNFRNIQVLAHSFGGIFMQQVGNLLVEAMQQHGFSQAEIDKATQQIVVITSGSVADVHKSKANFTALHILHGRDQVVTQHSQNMTIGNVLAGLRGQEKNSLAAVRFKYTPEMRSFDVAPDSPQMMMLSQPSPMDEATMLRLNDSKRGYKYADLKPEEITDAKFHECETYYDYSIGKDGMMLRLAAANVLDNALNNSIRNATANTVFEPLPSIEALAHSSEWLQRKRGFKQIKDSTEYGYDRDNDFSKVAKAIAYDERLDDAIHAKHNFKSAQL